MRALLFLLDKNLSIMEDKLDKIIKNQETLNKNQLLIFKELLRIEERLYKSESKEFIRNYLADLASTATAVLGLDDILKEIKKKLI